jgi:hypothetical protein
MGASESLMGLRRRQSFLEKKMSITIKNNLNLIAAPKTAPIGGIFRDDDGKLYQLSQVKTKLNRFEKVYYVAHNFEGGHWAYMNTSWQKAVEGLSLVAPDACIVVQEAEEESE